MADNNNLFITELVKSWQQVSANLLAENVLLKANIEMHIKQSAHTEQQVTDLKTELEARDLEIEGFKSKIETMETSLKAEGQKSSMLKSALDSQQQTCAKLQEQLQKLQKKETAKEG